MKLTIPTGQRLTLPTGQRLTVPHTYVPTIRNGLLWTSPLRDDARTIYDNGAVAYVDPSEEEADADGSYFDPTGLLRDAILNEARIEANGFLQEGTSKNELLHSREFDNVAWSMIGTPVITPNAAAGIDGAMVADTIEDDNVSSAERIHQTVTIPADSTWWSLSVHVKKDADETRFPELAIDMGGGVFVWVMFNTETGALAVRSSGGTHNEYVRSRGDYWKFVVSLQNNGARTSAICQILPARGTVLGTSSNAAVGAIIIDAAQMEYHPSATSFIDTTTSAVTRTVDDLGYASAGNVNWPAGSCAFAYTPHWSGAELGYDAEVLDIADISGSNLQRIRMIWDHSANDFFYHIRIAGTNRVLVNTVGQPTVRDVRIVFVIIWELGNYKVYMDGVERISHTAAFALSAPASSIIQFGSNAQTDGFNPSFANFAHPRIYNRAISAAEAVSITNEINGWMP